MSYLSRFIGPAILNFVDLTRRFANPIEHLGKTSACSCMYEIRLEL